ncbi:Abi family protein [Enterococcus innesii]|jgi:abortive infection bacteriophage resistance protein|uniref:Abi family protein n=1 Tax=Enterococcus innesii TaxID=2839759 RepID=UPI00232E3792|nr:Abi family protein [Enterococcus innesii]MDC0751893.1 Abi family protein [Enterococcus innesii]MDC0775981.1 Abi family protein [Enterococcus innesii]MDC0780868.1 Abi family protein [Enterococcus innesii]MDC0782637.1 Abi family protein [Enterococcus innesii]
MKKTIQEQVDYLELDKGITFKLISKSNAKKILTTSSYYYKLTCFRKNFKKNAKGRYTNVDFATLYDLSVIDENLRKILFKLCVDVEHTLKTQILYDISRDVNEDGYTITTEFDDYLRNLHISSNSRNPYIKVQNKTIYPSLDVLDYDYMLSQKYRPGGAATPTTNLPIWVLMEKMSLGTFCKFLTFYTQKSPIVSTEKFNYSYYELAEELLVMTSRIRNASAHNRPIIMDIGNNNVAKVPQVSSEIRDFYTNLEITKYKTRQHTINLKMLKNVKINDIMSILVLHNYYVVNPIPRFHRRKELKEFSKRLKMNSDLYRNQSHLKKIGELICDIIERY